MTYTFYIFLLLPPTLTMNQAEIASHDTSYRFLLLIRLAFSLTGTLTCASHSASNSFSQSSNQKSAASGALFNNWRKGRDSNSGRDRSLDGFQDRCIKPLCHLSILTLFTSVPQDENHPLKLRFNDGIGSNRHFFEISAFRLSALRSDSKTALIKPLCHLSILTLFPCLCRCETYTKTNRQHQQIQKLFDIL